MAETVSPRLKKKYESEVVPVLIKQFGYKNVMQAPKLEKIVINMGVGEAGRTGGDAKLLEGALRDMQAISGQKPVVTIAKKSVANFRLREGSKIGCKVTLRGARMYEFMDRLLSVTLPRVRDFQGVNPNSFDGRGNYAMGLKEQLTFPEIVYDKIDKLRGMDIIFVTTANSDEEARFLLYMMGMPFRQTSQSGPGGAKRLEIPLVGS
jgi:large subunit ribosomal protein L5